MARGVVFWWMKYLVLATIPALLTLAFLWAPSFTAVEGNQGIAERAGLAAGLRGAGDHWWDERTNRLTARLESEIDARISKILKEMMVADGTKRMNVESHLAHMEELTTNKADKAKIEDTKQDSQIGRKVKEKLESNSATAGDQQLDTPVKTQLEAVVPMEQPAVKASVKQPDFQAAKQQPTLNNDASAELSFEQITEKAATDCISTEVSKAPTEWCGKQSNGSMSSCFTSFEKAYLRTHQTELQKGLKALRAPGCFPHGTTVATMGYFRSGSTLLYNYARLWAALATGTSLLSGFRCKSPAVMGIGVAGKTHNCSVVCKDHVFHHGVAKEATVVLSSRRDPWESVCSRKLQKTRRKELWCRYLPQAGEKKELSKQERDEYNKECSRNQTMEAWESQQQCNDLMVQQAAIYLDRRKQGKEVALDVLMSDYQKEAATQVSNIGKAMGMCQEAYEDPTLVEFLVATGEDMRSSGKDHGMTRMHEVHTDKQRQASCSQLKEWMRGDEECREWMDGDASAESNAMLRRMTAADKLEQNR